MTMQGWGVKTIAGLGMFAGWFLACAGDDIPPIEDDLRGALAQEFGGAPSASAGSGGSGTGGRGGSGSGTSGSANNAGSGDPGGGAAGDGGEPVGGGGSGGDLPAPGCDAFPILLSSCSISSGCHAEGSGQGAFAVDEEGVVDFVDQASTKGACDQLFIDSANPEESLIYTRLFGTECGGTLRMPAAGDFLTDEESDCVLSWLQQFAE
jgi:hypothetical protein